jgi:hypothetical protein
MEHMPKEFAFGFLGWFVFANIAFVALAIMIMAMPSMDAFSLVLAGIWAPTAIALMILFKNKKIGYGIGVLAAIALNTIIMCAISPSPFYFFPAILTPIPSTYIVYILGVMDAISPPYNSNLSHLMDLFKRW